MLTGFAPDPAVPARDLLLDPAATADHLGARTCELVRVKYRIGESLRVTYRIDGRVWTVRSGPGLRPGGGRPDPALAAVWWAFPADRRLRGLADVLRPAPDLRALAPGWVTSELVEYAAERTATFRAADAGGATVGFAKAYAPGTVDVAARADRYDRVAAAMAGRGQRTPRALGRSAARGVLVLEPMPGIRWDERDPAALTRLGAAIGTLHGTTVPGLDRFGRLRVERVVHSAQLVARARPDVAGQVLALAGRLAAGPPAGAGPVVLHGDCHPKNALVHGDTVTLIDLDQAGLGPAAADVGSLLARLGPAATPFLTGYQSVRALPGADELAWHTAAALLAERAVRAVNRVHRPTLDRLGDVLDTADRALRQGVGP